VVIDCKGSMAVKGTKKKRKPALKAGAMVRFRFGLEDVTAEVIEDRGPLGPGGERIFRVRFQFEHTSHPMETEIQASELTVVTKAA
jgi:hypothetical protein